ncbi:ParB-like protein [Herbaspirillum sp. RTI4]|uniref:ParB-like protein n=1 Tax=Herbaspirillum sp. RTI4 TaxID=3048640 RepID=UPI002AB558CF|nr:ParB-like protein [Herbaspirillum sp. RTI4]MDY7579975.1 ParB-like protein [Herbaspirillum sp. RTI4]MEA9982881.1 ParB-like protein [Herbaspirillum sp. RTI4]
MQRAQPQLITTRLDKLHPTQITVGKLEVTLKRKQWGALGKSARATTLSSHWFPAVAGPDSKYYILDHHHFGLALLEEEVKTVNVMLMKDLSWLAPPKFWGVMDHHQWVHPYDGEGLRRDFSAVPHHLTHLHDDPYRSLAGELRRAGGFAKDVTPFSEFLWADYLRDLVDASQIENDFEKALTKAKKIARSQDARYLPGWCGVMVAN